jgi:hypothetical protein
MDGQRHWQPDNRGCGCVVACLLGGLCWWGLYALATAVAKWWPCGWE